MFATEPHNPDGGLLAASWLVGRLQADHNAPWPRRHTPLEVLEALRSTGDDPKHPLHETVVYVWSSSANRGTIWPLFEDGAMMWSHWSEVVSVDTPRRQKVSEYRREQAASKEG